MASIDNFLYIINVAYFFLIIKCVFKQKYHFFDKKNLLNPAEIKKITVKIVQNIH